MIICDATIYTITNGGPLGDYCVMLFTVSFSTTMFSVLLKSVSTSDFLIFWKWFTTIPAVLYTPFSTLRPSSSTSPTSLSSSSTVPVLHPRLSGSVILKYYFTNSPSACGLSVLTEKVDRPFPFSTPNVFRKGTIHELTAKIILITSCKINFDVIL